MAYLGLSFTMGNVFAAEFITGSAFGAEKCSPSGMVVLYSSIRKVQPRSFHDLVTALRLDHKVFSDSETLKGFGDINTRYNGCTPLHMLIARPDATIEQVKALLDRGANLNIPALVKISGQHQAWSSHKMGFTDTGASPITAYNENKIIFNQYRGNPKVINYIFDEMVMQGIQEKIKRAKWENQLQIVDEGAGVIILPRRCPKPCKQSKTCPTQDCWPKMAEDEAREFLKESVKDQKEFELFVQNLGAGAFEVFLKMQETYIVQNNN
jgi:hypothetical protein